MAAKIVYDIKLMKFMSMFENLTKARVKDCFEDKNGLMTFVVEEGEIGKALGRGLSNLRRFESVLNRKIKIVEFNPQPLQFIQNYIIPVRVKDISQDVDGVVTITGFDTQGKAQMIGRGGTNLRNLEGVCARYFADVKVIKVI